jgi:membrane-associated protease RseP (regulator of RpoE activity)
MTTRAAGLALGRALVRLIGLTLAMLTITGVILVHEIGHYAASRAIGVKVDRVVAGVGPRLIATRVAGTWFDVRLVPLLGYTVSRIRPRFGRPATRSILRTSRQGPRRPKPPWDEAIFVVAGPVASILFGLFVVGLADRLPRRFGWRRRMLRWWGRHRVVPDQSEIVAAEPPVLDVFGRPAFGLLGLMAFGGDAFGQGIPSALRFAAVVSGVLGVTNLIPLPPLDGGHILLLGCQEWLSPRWVEFAASLLVPIGVASLLVLTCTATILDFIGFCRWH